MGKLLSAINHASEKTPIQACETGSMHSLALIEYYILGEDNAY